MNTYLIVCLSTQFYDSPYKTNKHLVMDELGRLGHKVLFVNPPARIKRKKHLKEYGLSAISRRKDNFIVYSPPHIFNIFPLTKILSLFRTYNILNIIKESGWNQYRQIFWVYLFDYPRIWELKKFLSPDLIIYDVVDSYSDFPEYSRNDTPYKGFLKLYQSVDRYFKVLIEQKGRSGAEWVKYRENELAFKADIIFASHPLLHKKFLERNPNTFYTPNAGAFELYSQKPTEPPLELININKPIVGYSGAIDAYKFDVDLFLFLAKNTPEINYVLIGSMQLSDSDESVGKIRNLENVYLFGTRSFKETAKLTHYFDSFIIPYVVNGYTYNGCFPVKLFNVLSTGIPIIVTDLPAYQGMEDVLYIAKDKYQFLNLLRKSINENNEVLRQKRIVIASKNTWQHKVVKQLTAINNLLEKKP